LPTLFLDRDGVINHRLVGDYVKSPTEFEPTEHLTDAFLHLRKVFGRIIVVTNQAGIGKGLMGEMQLWSVHQKMLTLAQSCIDKVYYCPHRKEEGCPCRKPATGMAWQALADFADIDFQNAWMVGDSASDIQFGQALGMRTVWISGKVEDEIALSALKPDFKFDSLWTFSQFIAQNKYQNSI
jgi:histidinol-phosphate phosphatase family protein